MPRPLSQPPPMLLSLACGTPSAEAIAAVTQSEWAEIDYLAEQHRLKPWLFERWSEAPVPAEILARWRDSRRLAGMVALAQRSDLLAMSRLLTDAGIRAVALKGPWLAWYAYPAPALRPMNDIDLLVAPDQAMAAYELLRGAGYQQARAFETSPEHALAHDRHLPQLASPDGMVVELHMRCWSGDVPRPRDAGLLARARTMGAEDPLLYPAAEDMFAHLVVHATGAGRLDTGPLALIDLDRLLARETLDWPAVIAEAESEGWLASAALMLALVERWLRPGLLEQSGCPLRPPDDVLLTAERLMVQDLTTCREAQFLADLGRAAASGEALRRFGRRLVGGAATPGAGTEAGRDYSAEGGYWPWLADRVGRMLPASLTPRVRQQAMGYRAISAWCARDYERGQLGRG